MALLVAGVVLACALGVLNMVFVLSIMRRMREQAESDRRPTPILPAGRRAADFVVTTVTGSLVTRASLTGPTLVGFFSPGCGACAAALPRFVATAGAYQKDRVLAVVATQADLGNDPVVARLRDAAEVVRERPGGELQSAFGVSAHHVFAVVEPGGVVRSSHADTTDEHLPS